MVQRYTKCLRRLVLSSILALAILLVAGCLSNDQIVTRNTNLSVTAPPELPSGGRLIEIDPYEAADTYLANDMETLLPKLRLSPLPQTARPNEFMFRMWTNLGGLVDPKLLGFDFNGIDNEAFFFKMDRGAYAKSRRERLEAPKSGWNKMISELKSRLTTPKGLVRDPQFSLQRDEPLILLEVVDREEYSRVLYGKHTSFPDGKRLIEVCDYLAVEFGIDLNCRSERTAPRHSPSP